MKRKKNLKKCTLFAFLFGVFLLGCENSDKSKPGVIVNENNSVGASLLFSNEPFTHNGNMIVSLEPISMELPSNLNVRIFRVLPNGEKTFAPSDGTLKAQCGKYEVEIIYRGEVVFKDVVEYSGAQFQVIYAQKEFEVAFLRNNMGDKFGR